MPYLKRPRSKPTEDWSQLQLQLAWPEQVSYELIRPVVLFGSSPAERAGQAPRRSRPPARQVLLLLLALVVALLVAPGYFRP